jgi:hypothetical protein
MALACLEFKNEERDLLPYMFGLFLSKKEKQSMHACSA